MDKISFLQRLEKPHKFTLWIEGYDKPNPVVDMGLLRSNWAAAILLDYQTPRVKCYIVISQQALRFSLKELEFIYYHELGHIDALLKNLPLSNEQHEFYADKFAVDKVGPYGGISALSYILSEQKTNLLLSRRIQTLKDGIL